MSSFHRPSTTLSAALLNLLLTFYLAASILAGVVIMTGQRTKLFVKQPTDQLVCMVNSYVHGTAFISADYLTMAA